MMKRTQLLVTPKQYRALEMLARKTGLTASEHMRRALDEYLQRQPKTSSRTGKPKR